MIIPARKICDMCGETLEHYGDLIIKRRDIRACEMISDEKWTRLDVCSDCARRIKIWCADSALEAKND